MRRHPLISSYCFYINTLTLSVTSFTFDQEDFDIKPSSIPKVDFKNRKMAESKPEVVACTFDPADVPQIKDEATPQLIKCTFDAPKQDQEKEKSNEEGKGQKDDNTLPSDQKDEKAEEKQN